MAQLEFPLAQGWSRGLNIVFEDAQTSRAVDLDAAFVVDQVHGREIHVLSPADLARKGPLAQADGLFAQGAWIKECGRPLVIKTADCVPLFLIDRQSEAICALHAGWRGLQQGIHAVPFERRWMDPKFTWAWMGPCLSGPTFEVGEDMWRTFPTAAQRDGEIFAPHADPAKRYFHTWTFVERELRRLGIDLVYNVEIDTFTDPAFASYRRARQAGLAKAPDRNLSWVGFCERERVLKDSRGPRD